MRQKHLLQILVIGVFGVVSCTFSPATPETPGGLSTEAMEEATEPATPETPSGVSTEAMEEATEPATPGLPVGVSTYVVEETDGLFSIANKFDIEAETILFSNFDILQDNPLNLKPGIELYIPVVDGVVYRWQEGDQIFKVAARFHVKSEFITMWAGNQLDYVAFSRGEQIEINPGTIIFIPTGRRSMEPIEIPTISP